MIAVIDYSTGNVGSILNMLKHIGAESVITSDEETIIQANKLIMPGVGAYDSCMEKLEKSGLIPALEKAVFELKKPVLGICLGMQLFTKNSEEGKKKGLGWIDADTVRFRFEQKNLFRVPHMGWNTLNNLQDHGLFQNWNPESRFYFVHSYHVRCASRENVLATTNYGIEFHSVIYKDNIIGMQFHPEKSHKYGMQILKNFINL